MILCTITTDPGVHPERFDSFGDTAVTSHSRSRERNVRWENVPNVGLVPAMQRVYEEYLDDLICYVHDDVTCYEIGWDQRIFTEFSDPRVAIVGFGGATGIGVDDIYKTRYEISQLQRIGYASNQRDWEVHGTREAGAKDVAVVDGFFIAVRRKFLQEIGGFKWFLHRFHCYDTCLCLMAHRKGWKVRMVGIDCTHHGASYSASPEYKKWCHENGTTMEREHEEPHLWMYEFFRDELPLRIG